MVNIRQEEMSHFRSSEKDVSIGTPLLCWEPNLPQKLINKPTSCESIKVNIWKRKTCLGRFFFSAHVGNDVSLIFAYSGSSSQRL